MGEPEVVLKAIKIATVNALSEKLTVAMDAAHITITNQSLNPPEPEKSLRTQNKAIVARFAGKLNYFYDVLNGEQNKPMNVLNYANLSLVGEEDLEAMIALEGMISHSRNSDIREYLRFTTRLDTLLLGAVIDESNNPMDPEQLGEAFKEAISPLGLPAKELLTAYRAFNTKVFHELEPILEMANSIFVEHGVLPNLDLAARRRKEQSNQRAVARERITSDERAFNQPADPNQAISNPQLFSMMQNLMHGLAHQQNNSAAAISGQAPPADSQHAPMPSGYVTISGEPIGHIAPTQASTPASTPAQTGAGMVIGGKRVEMIEQDKLFSLLQELNSKLTTGAKGNHQPTQAGGSAPVDINKSLGELLEEKGGDSKKLQAIDSQSADVINLITMLYEVIWADATVPIPIKELIGRTQIKVLSIALKDATFFDSAEHPARRLINELATAGISWTESEKLDQDPVYKKMQEVVNRFIKSEVVDSSKISLLLEDFMQFKAEQSEAELALENRLADASERKQRIDEIAQYAHQKIGERILDESTPIEITEFLQTHFHKFVTEVLLREGPGGASWRPVMNTIDVLLWTVQAERNEGDIERFIKVNPRLLLNLGKALTVAGYEEDERESAIGQLKQVQENSFKGLAQQRNARIESADTAGDSESAPAPATTNLPSDDEHLLEVSKYKIGIWLEFKTQGSSSIRCTLAAKIETIDKYVFINGAGVKVIEKTKMGLAKELKAGTVRVISEAPLIERAMEAVIGNLRSNSAGEEIKA